MTHAVHPPEGTIRDWLMRYEVQRGDDLAFLFSDGAPSLSWKELAQAARETAHALCRAGATKGESVAVMMPNGRAAVIAFFGIAYGGFRATMINLAAGDEAISYALKHCEARLAFVGQDQSQQFERTRPAQMQAFEPQGSGADVALPDLSAQDHALLMYTSGTTGRPKGVLHSHATLLAGGWTTAVAHELEPADRGYCVLPICHINGLCVTVMGTLISGGSLVMAPKFSTSAFWHDIAAQQATWFSVVPTIISHLSHSEINPDAAAKAHLRFGRSASAPLAPEVQRNFEARFGVPIIETMGLTETAAQILSNPLPPAPRKIGSPGIAFGNQAAILGPDGQLGANQEGEIIIKGPNVMLGYLKNAEATAESFTKDGWLRTGDLGRQDEDGYVFVTGRLKELIIKGGENIAPREIDEALYTNEDVIEAAAFGVACDTYGERVEAAVTLRSGATVTQDALRDVCVAKLGKFKAPDKVFVFDELPKGPSGKIQRRLVAELALAQRSMA